MASKNDALNLLRIFALRKKSQIIPFRDFVSFSQKYAEQKKKEIPTLASLIENTQIQMAAHVEDLAEDKRCAIVYDEGRIGSVVYPGFFPEIVKRKYKQIISDPESPYPNEGSLDVKIPSDNVRGVDIKKDFVRILGETQDGESQLLRLSFPEGINGVLVPSDLLQEQLLIVCVEKIRLYLNTQRNSAYMLSKLRGVFKSREQGLRDMLHSVSSQRSQAIETIHNPTEFSFSFWTHLANAIIREYREKTNKLEKEHGYCQAAYLLGFYNVYYKGIVQKKKDFDATLKILDLKIRQAPYYFTISEVDNFKDSQGLMLARKCSPEEMHRYLETKSKPDGENALPEIFRLKLADKKEYFVAREVLLRLTAKKVQDASRKFRQNYLDDWMGQIRNMRKSAEMKSDDALSAHVEKRARSEDPLLSSLLSFELLYLTLQESKPSSGVKQEIARILDVSHGQLIPMDQILRLNRRDILAQAKMNLPMWMTMPLINHLLGFLKRVLSGTQPNPAKKKRKKKSTVTAQHESPGTKLLGPQSGVVASQSAGKSRVPAAAGRSARAQLQALQDAMKKLKVQFVEDASLHGSMDELSEKWNPLFDPQAKANLVEDVNSLVRDFLRKLKRGFLVKPPDAARIRNMADGLAGNHAFDQVKNQDALKLYIELYMIEVLCK